MKVDGLNISKYGVIVPKNEQDLIAGLIEKPNFQYALTNLVSIDRYVLTPDIFNILRNQSVCIVGEIQLVDTVSSDAVNNINEAVLLNSKRFDCINIKGYIEAIKHEFSDFKLDKSFYLFY